MEALSSLVPKCPKKAVSVKLMMVCARFPSMMGVAIRQISRLVIVVRFMAQRYAFYVIASVAKQSIFYYLCSSKNY